MKILAINPGSTSTKIAVYAGDDKIFEKTIRHSTKELNQFPTIFSQMSFRKEIILSELRNQRIRISDMAAVVGRGGLLKPMVSGTYAVNEAMVEDLRLGVQGQHASNLGGILAKDIAEEYNIPSFIVDPVVVDELQEVARISGLPEIDRKSVV